MKKTKTSKTKNPLVETKPKPIEHYKTAFDGEVDLNAEETYERYLYKDWGANELRDRIYARVGYIKLYIEQFRPGWDKKQCQRIDNMLYWFGREHANYWQDTPESRHWLRKWLLMFENETENMC